MIVLILSPPAHVCGVQTNSVTNVTVLLTVVGSPSGLMHRPAPLLHLFEPPYGNGSIVVLSHVVMLCRIVVSSEDLTTNCEVTPIWMTSARLNRCTTQSAWPYACFAVRSFGRSHDAEPGKRLFCGRFLPDGAAVLKHPRTLGIWK